MKVKTKLKKEKTKNVKVYEGVHKKLRVYVATTDRNITEFVSSLIENNIKK